MTEDTSSTERFECPDCGELYDQHVCIDGRQGCCPDCGNSVRHRAIEYDPDQTKLGGWSG